MTKRKFEYYCVRDYGQYRVMIRHKKLQEKWEKLTGKKCLTDELVALAREFAHMPPIVDVPIRKRSYRRADHDHSASVAMVGTGSSASASGTASEQHREQDQGAKE